MKYNLSKQLPIATLALVGLIATGTTQATTLTGNFNVDNSFQAYLSTNDSVAGNFITSGSNWQVTNSISDNSLTAGTDYFLHVVATNIDNVAGFIGEFNLSGTDHSFGFANTQHAVTNAIWNVSDAGWGGGTAATVIDGHGAAPWGDAFIGGITDSADWVWGDTTGSNQDMYFSLAINSSPVPVPSAVWLFGTGLIGFIGMRKKASA